MAEDFTTPANRSPQQQIGLTIVSALIRLLYVSRAKPDLQQQDIRQILLISRSRNAALGITGMLCVGKSDFIQVLEGPEEQVIKLYATILDDPRHKDCALLSIAPIETRIFSEWSMGYVHNKQDQAIDCRFLLAYRLIDDRREEIVALMQRFLALIEN